MTPPNTCPTCGQSDALAEAVRLLALLAPVEAALVMCDEFGACAYCAAYAEDDSDEEFLARPENHSETCTYRQAREFIARPQPARWIPVTERLPERPGCYLVYAPRNTLYGPIYRTSEWSKLSGWYGLAKYHRKRVTHWRELPPGPEDGQ